MATKGKKVEIYYTSQGTTTGIDSSAIIFNGKDLNIQTHGKTFKGTDTDTKVTSVGNHYAPSADANAQLTSSATSTGNYAKNTEYSVVTGVKIQRDAKGHVTGVTTTNQKVKDTDVNTAQLQVSDTTNKKINTSESTEKYIQFTGGTNEFTVSDGTNSFKVGVTPSISNNVTGSGLTADKIVLGNGSSTVKTSSKGITTTLGSDDTTVPTSKAVQTAITNATAGLTGAMHFIGSSSTAVSDGGTENPTIDGYTGTAKTAGNVVLYSGKEYIWTGSAWQLFGDEGSYALKTIKVEGTGVLGGGGTLESNRTITHNTSGITAGSYGPTADVTGSNNNTIKVPQITVDAYGHVTEVTERTYTSKNSTYTGYDIAFQNSSGSTVDTYKALTSPNKTVKAGSNITISATNNVITIAGTPDTKVTSVDNHYTPSVNNDSSLTANASGATAAWSIDVVKGVNIQRDAKGHVTGLSVTSGKIPANPNTDTKVTSVDNHYAPTTDSSAELTASISGTAGAYAKDTEYTVLTGVKAQRDAKGHITGLTYTAQKIKDTNTTYTVNNGTYSIKSLIGSTTTTLSDFTANQASNDDFTLVQGSNITFSNDTTNRKLTIAGTPDTKVTSVDNHYTPSANNDSSLSASASGATAAWSIDVVKGINLQRDAKGHVTGLSVTSGKIPANPNTDASVNQGVTTTESWRKVLLHRVTDSAWNSDVSTATDKVYGSKYVAVQPSSGTLKATVLEGGTIKKTGGTSSQFLKADGSVDSSAYLALSGGTMTGPINVSVATSATNTAQVGLKFGEVARIGVSSGVGIYSTGEIWIRPNETISNGSFTASNGLKISSTVFTYNGTNVSLQGHKHSYTDLTGSSTTANQAIVSSGTANGWTLKTLGSRAFDSSSYLPLEGGTLSGKLTINHTKEVLELSSSGTYGCINWKLGSNDSWSTGINSSNYFYFWNSNANAIVGYFTRDGELYVKKNKLVYHSGNLTTFVKSGSSAASGLVPKPDTTAGTTKFLREDGTWSVPSYTVNTNTAQLQVSDTTNRKINTVESTGKYIQFTGGTNKFTITDGTNSFDVGITPSISNNVTGSGLTADKIVLGDNNSAVKTSSKGITTTLGNDDTTVPTSKAVQTAITSATAGLTGAMHFIGASSTAVSDGGTENPTISGYTGTAKTAGNVVLYSGKEYIWTGSAWQLFGDEGSYALKTIKVEGTGVLGGGGTLESNRTITHNTSGVTAASYGPTADVTGSNNNTIKVPQITVDAYGHVTEVTERTYTSKDTTYTVNNATYSIKSLVGSTTTTLSDFTANQGSNDDFTLVQGSNITFTNDTSNRKLTIAGTPDTKVTSVDNHYTPAANNDSSLTANASGATAAWSIDVVKGVKIQRDAKGHVTGLSVTSGKIPANPNTDTKVTSVDNHYTPSANADSSLNSTVSSTGNYALNTEYSVVTGINIQRDAKGHVTGVTTTNQKIKDTNNTYTVGSKVLKVASNSGTATQAINVNENSADRTLTISGDGTYLTGAVSGSANAATVTISHADPTANADATLTSTASSTGNYALNTEYSVVTGVSLQRDAKGHVTGITTTNQKVKDTNTTYTVNDNKYSIKSKIGDSTTTVSDFTANQGSDDDFTLIQGSNITFENNTNNRTLKISGTPDTKVTSAANHYDPSPGGTTLNATSVGTDAWATNTEYDVIKDVSLNVDSKGHIVGISVKKQKVKDTKNTVNNATYSIKSKVGDTTTTISDFTANQSSADDFTLIQGSNITFDNDSSNRTLKISGKAGTVTKVSTGIGLTGGDITTTGTIKAKLKDETKNSADSSKSTSTNGGLYSVETDKSGNLAVRVPWTDNSVTAVGNHYAPSANADSSLNSTVSSTNDYTLGSEYSVVKAINIQRDAKGHVTGISTTNQKIKDTNTNTAKLQVSDTTNKKINTAESTGNYIKFTGGTNKFTITDGTNSFDVSVTPSIANNVTSNGNALTADKIVLGNGNNVVKTSSKGIVTTLGSDDTTVPTSKAVQTAITNATAGLTGAMHFIGTSTTAVSDGGTENPTISGYTGTAKTAGNVVLYSGKEYIWTGSAWELFGDEGSYALKTIKVEGTGVLGGGGTLESNRTITHNTSGITAGSYGPTADVTGVDSSTIKIPQITVDSYGHVTEVTERTYTSKNSTYTVNDASFTIKSKSGNTTTTISDFTANQASADDFTIIQGSNITLTPDAANRTLTIAGKAGTVTKVSTGVGLTGGDVTSTGTIKAKLKSETAATADSAAMGNTENRQYAVGVDKSGYLSVNIPWTDHTYTVNNNTFSIKSKKGDTTTTISDFTANQGSDDDFTLVQGSNITFTNDATNRTLTIAGTPDTKVTSVDNHYTPTTDSSAELTASLSGTVGAYTLGTEYTVLTGVKAQRDAKGHITGLTYTAQKVKDTNSTGYLPLSGSSAMTGAIKRYYSAASNDPMIAMTSNNQDIWLWRINHGTSAITNTSASYGFGLKYIGTGAGEENNLVLYSDAQTGSQVPALTINQAGKVKFNSTPNVNGTNVSLVGHTHSYLPLSGGTMTGPILASNSDTIDRSKPGLNFDIGRIGANATGLGVYSTGTIYIRPNETITDNKFSYTHGLIISDSSFTYNGNTVYHSGNLPAYPTVNNATYSIKSKKGDTTTTLSDFTANQSSADDFTLIQGSNITFTNDATNRTLTIAGTPDTKVTSVDNHYTPAANNDSSLTANASGATAAWSIDVVKGVKIQRDTKGHVTGLSVTSGKIPANPNTHYTAVPVLGATDASSNATSDTANNATFLNIVENNTKSGGIQIQGSGTTSVSAKNGILTISSSDSKTGTVTSVATGIGLTGGTITSSGTIKAKLKDETLNSADSAKSTSTNGGLYSVEADKSGNLAVRVPWTDTKVTSVDNHYAPSANADSSLNSAASSTGNYALNTEYSVVTGINIQRDAKGHVTGVTTTNQKIKDTNTNTKVTSAANHYAPSANADSSLNSTVSSTNDYTLGSEYSVVKAINIQRDAKGHVTGITTTNQKIKDTNTNTAKLQVSDTTNKKINTSESTEKYIQFTGGTNEFTVSDGTNSFKVGVTPSISNNVTGSGLTADKIVLGNGSSTVKTSSKGITTTLGSDDTTVPTSKAVQTAITSATAGLSGAMHFIGTSTSEITDGGTENPTISGYTGTAKTAGNVVLYSGKEYIWAGSAWQLFGDEGSYALKTITVTGTGVLGGGGNLSNNQTITHNTSGVTDGSYGPTADVTGSEGNTIKIPQIKVDSYGHITNVIERTYTSKNSTYTGYNIAFQNNAGTTVDTFKALTSPSKTLKAGTNVQMTAASNVITISSTDTDTKVTAVGNHYTPATNNDSSLNANASGATAAWSIDVVKGVTLQRDAAGHVTGLSVTSGKIPANPNTDTKVTSVGNHYAPTTDSSAELTASLSGTAGAYAINSEYTVLTGVKAQRDAKGHVTGLTYTAQKVKDTNTTYSATTATGITLSGTTFSLNVGTKDSTNASSASAYTADRFYQIVPDKNNKLGVVVPWENNTYTVNNNTFSIKSKKGDTTTTISDFTANQGSDDDFTLVQGSNITFTNDATNRTLTIAGTPDTTYKFTIGSTTNGDTTNGVSLGTLKSETAASGGTTLSLVTTGEKATWNAKTSNTGTVTKVSTGIGLTGGDVTTTGTIKAKLKDETKNSADSSKSTSTNGGLYSVEADKSGNLAVRVPWTDTNTKVTSVDNHYAPTTDSSAELTASLSGTAGAYAINSEYTVLTGVKAQRDAKGHITGLTYTAQKVKDTNTWQLGSSSQEGYVPQATKGKYLHSNASTGALEWVDDRYSENTDTKVSQSSSTTENWRKVLLHYSSETTWNSDVSTATNVVYGSKYVAVQPSSGTLKATVLEGGTIKKTGGTSSQFLKADGSVDSSAYLALSGGTMTGPINVGNESTTNTTKVGINFGEVARLGAGSSGSIGIYATGQINLRPNETLTNNSFSATNGVVIKSDAFTYNGNTVYHSGNLPAYPTVNDYTYSIKSKIGSTTTTLSDFTANQASNDDFTLIQGSNITFTNDSSNRTLTIAGTPNTTYKFTIGSTTNGDSTNGVSLGTLKSETAAANGTTLSLVTTGEKATWNAKTSNTGTVTEVSTGIGLTGGPINGSGTIKAKLKDETLNSADSSKSTSTNGGLYSVEADKSGNLAVRVPWINSWQLGSSSQVGYVPQATKGKYLHCNSSSGALEWVDDRYSENTDNTAVKKGTAGATNASDGTVVSATSSNGIIFEGGTNQFKVGNGTNSITVGVSHGLSTKNMSINGTNYALYTSAASLPTILAPSSYASTGGQVLATNSGKTALEWVSLPTKASWNYDDTYTKLNQSIPYIVGPNTDTVGYWTGTTSAFSTLVAGVTIIYVPGVAGGSSNTYLNINGTGNHRCYINSSKITTHYAVGIPIMFTYDGTYWRQASYWKNTWTALSSTANGYAPKAANGVASSSSNTYYFLGYTGTTVNWYQLPENAFNYTPNTDSSVAQNLSTANQESPILIKNGTGNGNITSGSLFASGITINPSTNSLSIGGNLTVSGTASFSNNVTANGNIEMPCPASGIHELIMNCNDIKFKGEDPGNLTWFNDSDAEQARVWTENGDLKARFGEFDASKILLHSGNISSYINSTINSVDTQTFPFGNGNAKMIRKNVNFMWMSSVYVKIPLKGYDYSNEGIIFPIFSNLGFIMVYLGNYTTKFQNFTHYEGLSSNVANYMFNTQYSGDFVCFSISSNYGYGQVFYIPFCVYYYYDITYLQEHISEHLTYNFEIDWNL